MRNRIKEFFTISSFSRRVGIAFTSIILILLFSGVTSLFELDRVSHDTEEILVASKKNVDLAGDMITALNTQNEIMILMAVEGEPIGYHREICETSMSDLLAACTTAKEVVQRTDNPQSADSLLIHTNNINELARSYINGNVTASVIAALQIDSLSKFSSHTWYTENYQKEYMNVSRHIIKYMSGSQNTLGPEVNRLSHSARRAVTPVFISLVVMLVIVVMFYFLFKIYFVKPVLRINRSLGNFLTYRMPFDNSIACRDEIRTLRERINNLTTKNR